MKKLKQGALSRTFDFVGVLAKSYRTLSKENLAIELLKQQMTLITEKLGNLKGAMMKVGQMLSVYGEYFLPKEVNEILKNLQSQSRPFDWDEIKKILHQEFGDKIFNELEIETTPFASASIGQVHKARDKSGKMFAIKVQYPGIANAIFNDLKSLKRIFKVANLFPQITHLDLLFNEVESMLSQELNYKIEMKWTEEYRNHLLQESNIVVPIVNKDWTSSRVITTEFQEGIRLDSPEVLQLPQEVRNGIAESLLKIYFKELFEWGFVQTDPHIGNYLIRLQKDKPTIVLLDFGAVREYSKDFLMLYKGLIRAALRKNYDELEKYSLELKFTRDGDPESLKKSFYEFCILMVEPFAEDSVYDWGKTDLPKRLTSKVANVIKEFHLRTPPQEVVFLDRKTAGVFISLSILQAKLNSRPLIESYLD